MAEGKKLPVGTRIRFLRELSQGATEETPPFLFAKKGELGTVVENKYDCWEGHMVKWDGWPQAGFGARLGTDFEEIKPDLQACMDEHNRKDVMCALTSCKDCEHSKGAVGTGSAGCEGEK